MKASDLRKEIDVNSIGGGNVVFSWLRCVPSFYKMFIVDDDDKIGFTISGKDEAKLVSLTDFTLEVFKREDNKEITLIFSSKDGTQMTVVAELKEAEERKNDNNTEADNLDIALELQTLLAESIFHNVFRGQEIHPSVEWIQKNCVENEKFDEFVGEWLKKNDTKGLLVSLRGDVFKTNVQIGVYALMSYLRIAQLSQKLCEDIFRCILDKPKA